MTIPFGKTIAIYLLAIFIFISTGIYAGGADVKFFGSLDEIYDDNVTFVKNNEKQDFITKLSFGLDAKYESREKSFDISGKISRRFFVNNAAFDNNSEEIMLNYLSDLSRYDRMNLKDSFSHTYEPRSLEDEFGRTSGRYSAYKNRFSLSYNKDFTKELNISTKYMNEIVNFSRSGMKDSYLNNLGLEGGYILTPFTNLNLTYDFSRRNFYSGEHSLSHSVALGIRKYLAKTSFFDGKTGVDFITPFGGDKMQKSLYSLSYTNELDINRNVVFSFFKQYTTSSYSPDIFDQWQFSGRLRQSLSARLGVNISAFYGEGKFILAEIKDKNTGADIGINYAFKENLNGSISYVFSEVTSTAESREYIRNTVSAGVNAYF